MEQNHHCSVQAIRVIKLRRIIAFSMIVLILLLTITGCRGNDANAEPQDGDGSHTANIAINELEADAESSRQMGSAAVPAVFVNDTYFRLFDNRQHNVPSLDDTWVYLGTIQSSVQGWTYPTQNFQTNNVLMIGSEIYHSPEGRIKVTESVWGDPLNEEVVGDSIIVFFEGERLLYVSEEAHNEAYKVMDSVVRHSLMIDGVIYSFMGSGRAGVILDDCVFLGEIISAVPIDEYPTENLQANRDIVVGKNAYRLPPEDNNDIVIDSYYFYKHLPRTFVVP